MDRLSSQQLTKPSTGPRASTGHRLGWWHGRAKQPDEVVQAVLNDYEHGKLGSGIVALSKKYQVPVSTVRDWVQFKTRYAT